MVTLFRDKVVKSNEGSILMELSDGTFADLINMIKPDINHCTFVVGGFAKGHFSKNIIMGLGPTYSINKFTLEAHVVIARILYECENLLLEKGIDHKGDEKGRQIGA